MHYLFNRLFRLSGAAVRWMWVRGILRRRVSYREIPDGTDLAGDRLDNGCLNGVCGFGLLMQIVG